MILRLVHCLVFKVMYLIFASPMNLWCHSYGYLKKHVMFHLLRFRAVSIKKIRLNMGIFSSFQCVNMKSNESSC